MGLGLGGLIDDNTGDVDGLPYLAFVAPGIMAAAALQSAAGDALWPVMSGIKWTKTFHAATATPLAPADVYVGYLLWVGARLAMNATAFLVVAALLGGVPSLWAPLAVPAVVAGGLAFAAPVCAYAARQDSDLSFPIIMRILVMPMFLFSGTFFAVDQLPAGVRPLAWLTPLWHAVELARGATTGTLEALPVLGHVAFLAACIAIGWWFGARAFERRLAS
jgi:lipooligosaccharide transport system permease protein